MKGNLYAMITSHSSRQYTDVALDSFIKFTKLDKNDEFVVIDNDNAGNIPYKNTVKNQRPKSFAENSNSMIDYANGRTLFLLSNDVVFTKDWNLPLQNFTNVILIPSCNQTHCYTVESLQLTPSMKINEFDNKFELLNQISKIHTQTNSQTFFETLLMSFYVFVLPEKIYKTVGYFDESFGIGGGEDVDYRIRTLSNNLSVKYHSKSYLLHFGGKSTWDGVETENEIHARNRMYQSKFLEKWGKDLTDFCLITGNPKMVIKENQLDDFIHSQDFSSAIKRLLNNHHRT